MASLLHCRRLPPCIQVPGRWKISLSVGKLRDRTGTNGHGGGLRLSEVLPSLSVGSRRCLHLTAASHQSSAHHHSVTVDIGDSPLTFSAGKYVKLADGAILAQSGETSVMVTAVSEKYSTTSGVGTPLIVDYRERFSATNKIPLTFFRRELRATSSEILVSRFIDRSIRPLFPSGYNYNTQVICNMLAVDRRHDPEILSINGASAALAISDIPWNGPIGAVRIGLIDGQFCVNPSRKMLNSSKLNLIVASTTDRIVMVEGSANEVSEEQFCEAVHLGFKEAQPLIASLSELQQTVNKQPRVAPLHLPPEEIVDMAKIVCEKSVKSILLDTSHKKISRDNLLFSSLDELKTQAQMSGLSVSDKQIGHAFWDHVTKETMQSVVLDHQQRCDGRGMADLRPISCEVDVFKPLHGCSIFTRGETQIFCSVTFDSPRSAYRPNLLSLILGGPKNQNFMVHYEFPPFATNSTGLFLGMGRREIGHGCLAEKALAPLMPSSYPFTVRVNAQVLESNGSSSMATVCAGSLALFDAGVPMPHAVAGVACGLFSRTKPDSKDIEKYQILSDINGIEDSLGNMDFKMAGTRNGITSVQVDVKGLSGIPFHIFEEAVMQSRDARFGVLDTMDETLSTPREGIKEHGPAYAIVNVPAEKRGRLFGAGGYRIKAIAEDTETVVEGLDDEKMSIFAPSQEAMEEAKERIDAILNETESKPLDIQIGSVIEVEIKDIREYGFMAELAPGILALLHLRQLSHDFTTHPSESGIKVGDKVDVKFLGRDTYGRYLISRKALLPPPVTRQPLGSRQRSQSAAAPNFEAGSEYEGEIIGVRDYGFLLEMAPGVTTLLHNSQLSHSYVSHPSVTGFNVGDKVKVQFQGYDPQGRLLVSHKVLLPPPPSPSPANRASNERQNRASVPRQQPSTAAKDNIDAEIKRLGLQFGEVIEVTIKDVRDFGFKVEVAPGSNLLLHISQLSYDFIPHPYHTGLKIGDKILVKVLGPDPFGRISLSRKALLSPPVSGVKDKNDTSTESQSSSEEEQASHSSNQSQSVVVRDGDDSTVSDSEADTTTTKSCS